MVVSSILYPLIFLLGASILMAVKTAIRRCDLEETESLFSSSKLHFFFFRFIEKLFHEEKSHPLNLFLNLSITIFFVAYGTTSLAFLLANRFFISGIYFLDTYVLISSLWLLIASVLLIFFALLFYVAFHLFASHATIATLKLFSFPATLLLIILFPFVYPILWLERKLTSHSHQMQIHKPPSEQLKVRLLEILEDSDFEKKLDVKDKKLIRSLAQFGDLVAREIMVPKVRMSCLPENATLFEALQMFIKEGYSRIPLYQESIDHITSVLLYKDLMEHWFQSLPNKDFDIKKFIIKDLSSSILYAPENKKIRDLFQEMRSQKIHAAVIVDEYGCTEGMITIEDILEELIGSEILDEHDIEAEAFYKETPDKAWIVDARMSIVDVEKELGVHLPHNVEYETIGGYISWKLGQIPSIGTTIYVDNVEIKVLEADQKQVHKVRISLERVSLQ